MSSVQDDNSQEVLNQTYSSKDFAKDAISLQSASVDEIVEYASKNFNLDTNQIDSFMNYRITPQRLNLHFNVL